MRAVLYKDCRQLPKVSAENGEIYLLFGFWVHLGLVWLLPYVDMRPRMSSTELNPFYRLGTLALTPHHVVARQHNLSGRFRLPR